MKTRPASSRDLVEGHVVYDDGRAAQIVTVHSDRETITVRWEKSSMTERISTWGLRVAA